jgi:hypothetical protein
MPTYDYMLYDTALFGTTANTDHVLFQEGQGTSASKGRTITNMRGGASLPTNENFVIHKIGVHIDDIMSEDDIAGLFFGSLLTLEYINQKVLEAPLYIFSDHNMFGGVQSQASASDFVSFGQEGMGYTFKSPRVLTGGESFKVTITQGLALDSASLDVKCVLYGELTTS